MNHTSGHSCVRWKSLKYSSGWWNVQNYIGENLFQAGSCHQNEYSTGRNHFSFHKQMVVEFKKQRKTQFESLLVRKFIECNLVVKSLHIMYTSKDDSVITVI